MKHYFRAFKKTTIVFELLQQEMTLDVTPSVILLTFVGGGAEKYYLLLNK